jgi:hypothetical protein
MSDRTNSKKKIRILKSPQKHLEKWVFLLSIIYPLIIWYLYITVDVNWTTRQQRNQVTIYEVGITLPFILLVIYFSQVMWPKVFLLQIRNRIINKLRPSKTEIAGLVILFDCMLALLLFLYYDSF